MSVLARSVIPGNSGQQSQLKGKAGQMRVFAFDGTEKIATSTQVDRTPIGTDWFRKRVHTGVAFGGSVFSRLEDSEFKFYPSNVTIDSKRFQLTPWVGYAAHWGVSSAVKDIIESLEPGKHQFIPVKLSYGSDGKCEAHDYFTLQVNALENAVDLEKSDVVWEELPGGVRYWRPKAAIPMVLPFASVSGLHLWRNEKISKWMMSGTLRDALERNGQAECLTFEEHFVI